MKKILYLHGYLDEERYPDGGIIYKTLKKYLDIDYIPYSSDPFKGYKEIKDLDFSKYDLIIGFSLGGIYALSQNKIPVILINPGFGISKRIKGFQKLEEETKDVDKDRILAVMLGKNDRFNKFYYPGIQKRGLENKIIWNSGDHVLNENVIEDEMLNNLKELVI